MANINNNSTDDLSEYIPVSKNKAVIKSVDMSDQMKIDAIDCAIFAMEKYNVEKDIAAHVKNEFDKKFGTTWHCIVGRNFGSYVTHGKLCGSYVVGFIIDRNKTFYIFLSGTNCYSSF